MNPEVDRTALMQLLRDRSLKRGDFVLASGARSSYYIDARLTTMSGAGQLLIGRLGLHALDEQGWDAASVGGLTLGADPVAYAIAHAAASAQRALDSFTVRKEAKAHGTGRRIEGNLSHGTRVVLVEDVITSGGSALQAKQVVEEAGAIVLGVLAVVDREQGGREKIRESGCEVVALCTASDLLAE